MATALQTVESGILTALAAAIQANPGVIEGIVATGEADVQAALVNLFKNIPAVKGIASLAVGPLEAAVEASINTAVAALIAKYTPAEVEALVVTLLNGIAGKV